MVRIKVPPRRLQATGGVTETPQEVPMNKSVAERIAAGRVRNERSGCLEWQRACVRGYGVLTIAGSRKQVKVHRVVWEMNHGAIPAGTVVMHICDNPKCSNLEHLRLGSHAENSADRNAKGRHAHGARHGLSSLTETQVCEARLRVGGGETSAAVARSMSRSKLAVWRSVIGETWSHITEPAPLSRAPRP